MEAMQISARAPGTVPPSKPPRQRAHTLTTSQRRVTLASLLRQFIKADKADTEATQAWEHEQFRVRKMYPQCPNSLRGTTGRDYRHVPSAQQYIDWALADGKITTKSRQFRDLQKWKAECEAVDAKHLNRSLERAAVAAKNLLDYLDQRFHETPAKTLADIKAKLDYCYYFREVDDDGAKQVALDLRGTVRNLMRKHAQ
jgi:hypothetical protein